MFTQLVLTVLKYHKTSPHQVAILVSNVLNLIQQANLQNEQQNYILTATTHSKQCLYLALSFVLALVLLKTSSGVTFTNADTLWSLVKIIKQMLASLLVFSLSYTNVRQ